MTIADFILAQAPGRQKILTAIHEIIINAEKKVTSEVGTMMGKEMILYKTCGVFKYGLSSVKGHISLHLMPVYGSSQLHAKYKKLLNKAKFQKGCINFNKDSEMPLDIVRDLLNDCAKIDLISMLEKIKKNPN